MSNEQNAAQAFCQEIVRYLKDQQEGIPSISEVSQKEVSPGIQNLIKSTQERVNREIHTLLKDETNEERLLNLFVIDHSLYQLHRKLCEQERIQALHLSLKIEKSLKNHLKVLKKKRIKGTKRYRKHKKWITFIRVLSQLIGITTFATAFFYPQHGTPLLTTAIICAIYILLFEGVWNDIAHDRLKKEKRNSNPTLTKKSLEFVQSKNLQTLFEPISFTSDYQSRYFEMLIAIGSSSGWKPKRNKDLESFTENAKELFSTAYSTSSQPFDPKFISQWRDSLEIIQKGLHKHFGDSLKKFSEETKRDPLYFLKALTAFQHSSTAKALHSFLQQTESLIIE